MGLCWLLLSPSVLPAVNSFELLVLVVAVVGLSAGVGAVVAVVVVLVLHDVLLLCSSVALVLVLWWLSVLLVVTWFGGWGCFLLVFLLLCGWCWLCCQLLGLRGCFSCCGASGAVLVVLMWLFAGCSCSD